MNATDRLAELFLRFPGIGPKQAQRFVYFLLREHSQYKEQLIKALEELKFTGKQCVSCFRYFGDKHNVESHKECSICLDASRHKNVLMIVEKELDSDAIEKTGSYDGQYFIIGGLVPPLSDKPTELIRIRELVSRVHMLVEQGVLEEIIYALPVTDYGDTTKDYIEKTLSQVVGIDAVTRSTLARGLSSGLELEYVDKDTFTSALERRK